MFMVLKVWKHCLGTVSLIVVIEVPGYSKFDSSNRSEVVVAVV